MHVEVIKQPTHRGYYFHQEHDNIKVFIRGCTRKQRRPSIKIFGYSGKVVLKVSCVTKSMPYRPHPCMLTGLKCEDGVYVSELHCHESGTSVTFRKLIIMQHSQPSTSLEASLLKRKEMNVDPFKTGFEHIKYARNYIDLDAVRLCFEVFTKDKNDLYKVLMKPALSDVIYNSQIELSPFRFSILKLCKQKCRADGSGLNIIVHCNRLLPQNLKVCVFEVGDDGEVTWESYSSFHAYVDDALQFSPPKYRNVDITEPVSVLLQLRQLVENGGTCSEAIPFYYVPLDANDDEDSGPVLPAVLNTDNFLPLLPYSSLPDCKIL